MGKRTGKDDTDTIGHKTWVKGSKLEFFISRKDEFLAAQDAGTAGEFYWKMVWLVVLQYRWDLAWNKDGSMLADVPDSAMGQFDMSHADPETKEERKQIVKNLKSRVGQWFRHHFKRVETRQLDLVEEIVNAMQESAEKPRKQSAMSLYSNRYYDERIKDKFNEEWAKIKGTVPTSMQLSMCSAFIQETYEKESQEFHDTWEKETEATYKKKMEDYTEGTLEVPTTAAEFKLALDSSPRFLIPVTNALAKHLGAYVTIMICAPDTVGDIEVKSMHSVSDFGCSEKIWAEWDTPGYIAAERSLMKFGAREECNARKFNYISVDPTFEKLVPMPPLDKAEESDPVLEPSIPTQVVPTVVPMPSIPAQGVPVASIPAPPPQVVPASSVIAQLVLEPSIPPQVVPMPSMPAPPPQVAAQVVPTPSIPAQVVPAPCIPTPPSQVVPAPPQAADYGDVSMHSMGEGDVAGAVKHARSHASTSPTGPTPIVSDVNTGRPVPRRVGKGLTSAFTPAEFDLGSVMGAGVTGVGGSLLKKTWTI
ncbi:hypothetical protein DXG01_001268 [Tephrocybe rancida]|nr:hypothetical protein DXG01_001268 [Tephrocybe rancida]